MFLKFTPLVQIHVKWHGLTEGQRAIGWLIGINGAVFLAWRVQKLHTLMRMLFMNTYGQRGEQEPAGKERNKRFCLAFRYSSMVLSNFSHHNLLHLGVNM